MKVLLTATHHPSKPDVHPSQTSLPGLLLDNEPRPPCRSENSLYGSTATTTPPQKRPVSDPITGYANSRTYLPRRIYVRECNFWMSLFPFFRPIPGAGRAIPCEAGATMQRPIATTASGLILVLRELGPRISIDTSSKGGNGSPPLGKSLRSAVKSLK